MSKDSEKTPAMREISRYPAPVLFSLPSLGTVKKHIEENTDDPDYIPHVSGKDHPEYICGRRDFKGITHEEFMKFQACVDECLRNLSPLPV
jgi:hypothetical protein